MTDKPKVDPMLLPLIRNNMPNAIAEELGSVQPFTSMTANMINPFSKKWERICKDGPTDKWVYNIRSPEIKTWIEEQPVHMWKYYDIPDDNKLEVSIGSVMGNYLFTDEMEVWFQLRWS